MQNRLYVIGVGPGSDKYLLPAAKEIIETCDVLIGGKRNLEGFKYLKKDEKTIGGNLSEITDFIKETILTKKIAVLVSGDAGIYSMLGFIERSMPDIETEVIPGISSLQYFSAKLGLEWAVIKIASVHGRDEENILSEIIENEKTFIFTGGKSSPASVSKLMVDAGILNVRVFVGENLSYRDERIVEGSPEEISRMSFDSLSVMVVLNREIKKWAFNTPGIPDSLFTRGNVPMTKEEIRALSICKLRLTGSNKVADIGAGTGSVSVECGLLSPNGRVYAIEKEAEAVALIKKNAKKLQAYNVEVIQGKAPEILEKIPEVDRVFIGGSSGKMGDIIRWAKKCSTVRIVINTITLESTYEALTELGNEGFEDIEILNASISKGKAVGGKHMMQALNPIYIISAEISNEENRGV